MKEIVLAVLQEEDHRQQLPFRRRVVPLAWLQPSGPVRDHPLLSVLFLGKYTANGPRINAEVSVQDERLTVELGVSQNGSGH